MSFTNLPSALPFTIPIPIPSYPILLVSTVLYLYLVHILRALHLQKIRALNTTYLSSPSTLTYKTGHTILLRLLIRDFPFMYTFGTQWALIKSYGIPNGASLLCATSQLTSPRTVGKRAEDTSVLIQELLVPGLDSRRGRLALAKMNWLHRRYGARITNGDLLHTLGLFVLEPLRWIDEREIRKLEEVERQAVFVVWREIGLRMGIRGIPGSLEELAEWMERYEEEHMYFAESNKRCVDVTRGLFLRSVPRVLHGTMCAVTAEFVQPYVRPAIGMPEPPWWAEGLVDVVFKVRRVLLRHAVLPRFYNKQGTVYERRDGMLARLLYRFEPWYVPETLGSRIKGWLLGGVRPGEEFMSGGFTADMLEPREFEEKCRDDVQLEAEMLREYAEKGGGCPFAFVR